MKNIFKTLLLSAGVLSLSACSDFLDQTSPSEQTTQNVYESPYYTGLTINKIYGLMGQDQTYSQYIPIVWGLNSDCELVDGLGNDAYNTSSERGVMNYNASPGWANIAKLWDAMYQIIEYANIAIEGIDGSSLMQTEDSNKKAMLRYKGEALTLRAMVYFDLVRFFGDIPLKMATSSANLDNVYLEKTDRDEIMDQLISDLETAIELLPWADEIAEYTTERATKGYAHALLANIALTRAGYAIRETSKPGYVTATENSDPVYPTQRCDDATRKQMYELALSHLTAVINSGRHNLNPSVENEWYLLNQRQLDQTYRENIFEIPMGLGVTGELGYTIGVRINGSSTYYGEKGNSSGKMKLTAPFFWSYDKNDVRRDITCAQVQLKQDATTGLIQESLVGNTPFGIYVGKWDIRKMNEEWRQTAINTGNAKWMSGINCVRMRHAQVLLMYAEVMNELAGGPDAGYTGDAGITAREALRAVHTRAFDDANKAEANAYIDAISGQSAFFDAIVDENAWELAGEGFRKFDLVRWNLLSQKIEQMKEDYLYQQANEYPEKVYFNYSDESKTVIDMASVTWYETPDAAAQKTYAGSTSWFGTYNATQVETNLPTISSGLNSEVKNRHLVPIASTTISASNGRLHNSYGFTD